MTLARMSPYVVARLNGVVRIPGEPATRNMLVGSRAVDNRSSLLSAEKTLNEIALDWYLLVRDVYLARRRSLVDDGAAPARSPAEGSAP